MFVGLGVGAYQTGMFHLFTHAFFKALLFLGAGSVIHAVSDEQDMRKMGGLRTHIPWTYWLMVIGTLALTGFPLTAGYFSKDAIIEAAYAGSGSFAGYGFVLTVVAAAMTSFYSWRLIFMTFHGRPNASPEVMKHIHESPLVMLVPLGVLAAGSILAGLLFEGTFLGAESADFWAGSLKPLGGILEAMDHVAWWVSASPTVAMIIGAGIAVYFYLVAPDVPRQLAERHDWLYRFLLNKWYFDELYDVLFVRSAKWIGRFLWKQGDGWLIDGFGPDGVSAWVIDMTNRVVRLQTGYLYHYAFAMLIGVAALVTYIMFAP
jgi:NADH-quinone oxidoreductase subunit L